MTETSTSAGMQRVWSLPPQTSDRRHLILQICNKHLLYTRDGASYILSHSTFLLMLSDYHLSKCSIIIILKIVKKKTKATLFTLPMKCSDKLEGSALDEVYRGPGLPEKHVVLALGAPSCQHVSSRSLQLSNAFRSVTWGGDPAVHRGDSESTHNPMGWKNKTTRRLYN